MARAQTHSAATIKYELAMLAGAVVLECRPSFTGTVLNGPYLLCAFIAHLHGCLMRSGA